MPLTDQDVVTGGAPVSPAVAAAAGAGGSTPTSAESASTPRNPAAAAQQFERQPVPAHALDHSAVIRMAIGDLSVQPAALQPGYYANHVIRVLLADPNRYFGGSGAAVTTGSAP